MTKLFLARLLPVVVPFALLAVSACAVQERDFGAGGADGGSSDVSSGGIGGDVSGSTGQGGFGGSGSVGTGPGFCDDFGICGVSNDNGCAQCATMFGAPCADAFEQCLGGMNPGCEKYVTCLSGCSTTMDPFSCSTLCGDQQPFGAMLYQNLLTCVYCKACPGSCQFDIQQDPTFKGCP